MSKLFIPIILGTARAERQSEKVVKFVLEELQKREGVETELIDVKDFPMSETVPSWVDNPSVSKWKETVIKADGFIIVSPEYNHGYPGELKMLLDTLLKEYERKPVAICGVSRAATGGARMVQHLLPVLTKIGMVPLQSAAYFSNVEEMFDQNGKIVDAEKWQKITDKIFDELIWYAKVLKKGREEL